MCLYGVSYRELLEKVGPLGQTWRSPEVLVPISAFSQTILRR